MRGNKEREEADMRGFNSHSTGINKYVVSSGGMVVSPDEEKMTLCLCLTAQKQNQYALFLLALQHRVVES